MNHFLLSLALTVFLFFPPVSSLCAQWRITQLTDNVSNDLHPQINNNGFVVWNSGYGSEGGMDIFLYNGAATVQLSSVSRLNERPQINDNNEIVWLGSPDGTNLQVFLYDGIVTQLTDDEYGKYDLRINEQGKIIWSQLQEGTQDIVLYDDPDFIMLTDNDYDDLSAEISDSGYVTWFGSYAPENIGIFLWEGDAGPTMIADGAKDGRYLSLNNSGQVAWVTNDTVSAVNLFTGTESVKLSGHYQADTPSLNNNGYVAWQEYTFNDYYDWTWKIFLHNGTDTVRVSDNAYSDEYPKINDNNYLVWQGFDGHDYEIFVFDGQSIVQITDNGFDDLEPKINNDNQIVWIGDDGNDFEIFLARPMILTPEDTWAVTYGTIGPDTLTSLKQTFDRGYIGAGVSDALGTGSPKLLVNKFDDAGSLQWQKTIGEAAHDKVSVDQTADGGFIAIGTVYSTGSDDSDLLIVKLDETGLVQWQKLYGGENDDYGIAIGQKDDGSYIAAGLTESYGAGDKDIWLLGLDSDGAVVWQKTYGDEHPDTVESMEVTSDNGCIIVGETWSYAFGTNLNSDMLVMKTNSVGTVTWSKIYGGADLDRATAVQQTGGGGYIVAGTSTGNEVGDYFTHAWVLKLDGSGAVLWNRAFGSWNTYQYPRSVSLDENGGFIIAGYTNSGPSQSWADGWLLQLDSAGEAAWKKGYGGPLTEPRDVIYSLEQTADGGLIAGGATESSGIGDSELWLLKMDASGMIDDCPITREMSIDEVEPDPACAVEAVHLTESVTTATAVDSTAVVTDSSLLQNDGCGPVRFSGVIALPATGQRTCYSSTGAEIPCTDTGQDGESRSGVAWPSPRFTVSIGDGTVTDHLTGLIWAADSAVPDVGACTGGGVKTWLEALAYVNCINDENYLGHDDWRLPNGVEAWSLTNFSYNDVMNNWLVESGFTRGLYRGLPSSTSWPVSWTSSAIMSHYNSINIGVNGVENKGSYSSLIPVRGPEEAGEVSLHATNQNTCYADFRNEIDCVGSGQDGELRTGTPWPVPRFVTSIEKTVADRLTGLMWAQDAQADTESGCLPGGDSLLTWQESLDYVKCLNTQNYLGYPDWRLPNVVEMRSLLDLSRELPALPVGHTFSHVAQDSDGYWTSSTNFHRDYHDEAWWLRFDRIYVGSESKNLAKNVWPVRGGIRIIYNLSHVITCLKIISGQLPADFIGISADINGDRRIGLPEAIHALQMLAGISL
jgi:hypothetical protein